MERVATNRGRPKGTRGRGKGKRGRKPRQIVSDEDDNIETGEKIITDEIQNEDPVVSENNVTEENQEIINATTDTKSPEHEIGVNDNDVSISEADHDEELELEAPSFTTMQRNVPQVMLRLNWDHKVNLIGEKVLNPMIYCCDQCEKPILVYGRMIPCKHVFCFTCARTEVMSKQCPRCKDKVVRVEQARLGTVFMCTYGGTRYGSAGCRRTYLSQRDLQAHINHRHMVPALVQDDIRTMTDNSTAVVIGTDQQQSPSNNMLLRKDSNTMLYPSRMANDNNHQHSQLTPTKKSFISQDSGSFYNQQHNQFGTSNNYNSGSSSASSQQNNFFQQQSYHHQNFNNSNNSFGHYSQQQGQHQQQNTHHQQPQWNQYYR